VTAARIGRLSVGDLLGAASSDDASLIRRAKNPGDADQPAPGGPFVIVTGSGDRVPDSRAYDDWGEAVQVRDRANRRAAWAGRQARYEAVPAACVPAGAEMGARSS
jgi:hypothetical protein